MAVAGNPGPSPHVIQADVAETYEDYYGPGNLSRGWVDGKGSWAITSPSTSPVSPAIPELAALLLLAWVSWVCWD